MNQSAVLQISYYFLFRLNTN